MLVLARGQGVIEMEAFSGIGGRRGSTSRKEVL
jgi:hypothetical protein